MAAISGRDVLPIPDRPPVGTVHYDAKDPEAAFPPITQIRPPAGAPNVLVILLDDVGFGASTTFGGPCRTPTADRLAGRGLKYNRFHTTALCAPTRAALLTGRNHHAVGMGSITETATSAPGYNSMRPNTCAPLAEILRLNGYATAQFGKCHEVPAWETSPIGPFDLWPTSSGFQHFYGFVAGETNQYYPALWEGTTPAEPWGTPEQGYHLMPDLRRGLWQSEEVRPAAAARKRLRRAGAERPDAPVRYIALRQSIRPAPENDGGARDTAGRVYRHQWFVRPHRRTYPDQDDPSGYFRKWVGPYLVTPAGCEDAPILGRERVVSVLRR